MLVEALSSVSPAAQGRSLNEMRPFLPHLKVVTRGGSITRGAIAALSAASGCGGDGRAAGCAGVGLGANERASYSRKTPIPTAMANVSAMLATRTLELVGMATRISIRRLGHAPIAERVVLVLAAKHETAAFKNAR